MNDIAERQRLAALRSMDLLDGSVEARFELMAQAAARLLGIPLVSITIVDEHRQWRLALAGPLPREAPLTGAVCPEAMHASSLFVVPDLAADPRFANSPYVTGEAGLRFYAGWPLKAPGGEPIGAFCVMDTKPRRLSWADREIVCDLGRWVQEELLRGVRPPLEDLAVPA